MLTRVWTVTKYSALASWSAYFWYWAINRRIMRDSGALLPPGSDKDALVTDRSVFGLEFITAVIGSIILEIILYYWAMPAVERWYMNNLEKGMTDRKRETTAVKAGLAFNQLVKSVGLVTLGHYALKGQPFVPWILGGSMGFEDRFNHFVGEPNHNITYPYHNLYYTAVIMRYLTDLIYLPKRKVHLPKDYYVILIHHTITLMLMCCSYIGDFTNAGAAVMHLHNYTEPFLCLCRMSNSVPLFDLLQLDSVNWIFMTGSWGVLRLYVWPVYYVYPFGKELINILMNGSEPSHVNLTGFDNNVDPFVGGHFAVIGVSTAAFIVLQAMHVFWFGIFLHIGAKAVLTGVKEDAISADTGYTKESSGAIDSLSDAVSASTSGAITPKATSQDAFQSTSTLKGRRMA